MKIKYLKLKNWLLFSLGGLLGINLVSCRMMYGTPEATYNVAGKVANEVGQPIEGIEVDAYPDYSLRTVTDKDGRYMLTLTYIWPGDSLSLDFRDIDSTENGYYRDTTVTVPTKDLHLVGGDGEWYDGEGFIVQNITLKEKTDK